MMTFTSETTATVRFVAYVVVAERAKPGRGTAGRLVGHGSGRLGVFRVARARRRSRVGTRSWPRVRRRTALRLGGARGSVPMRRRVALAAVLVGGLALPAAARELP